MRLAETKALALLRAAGINEAPVPVDTLASHCGARLSFEPLQGDVSGMLFRGVAEPVIGVNSFHSNTRQRFTVAHELGHLLLHEGRPMIVDHVVRVRLNLRDEISSLATDKQEIEANRFAAELLMPRDWIIGEVEAALENEHDLDEETLIRELAESFEVSTQAMEYRLVNLGVRLPH